MPSIPSGYALAPTGNPNYLASQLQQQNAAAAAAAAGGSKLMPMIDPSIYYSIYNRLFPGHGAPPPEFSAYYLDLIANAEQPRLSMLGHQPTVPTSK